MAACFLGAEALLAKVFSSLSYPHTAHEKKSFGATEVEVVCCLERSEASQCLSRGSDACMTLEKVFGG